MTSPPSLTPSKIWKVTLDQLKLQMVKTEFDLHLKNTWFIEEHNDVYIIGVANDGSQDWLTHRMKSAVERTLSNIAGKDGVRVEFLAGARPTQEGHANGNGIVHQSTSPFTDQNTTDFDFTGIDYRKLYFLKSGFQPLANYHALFLRAYLGLFSKTAFSVWETLQVPDRRNVIKSRFTSWWTPPERVSIRHLAEILGVSTPTLSGRMVPCWFAETQKQMGEPLHVCCMKHQPSRWYPDEASEPELRSCRHWKPGAIEILQKNKILLCQISPTGRTTTFQVWRIPPILKPSQVELLAEGLQRSHQRWLDDYGHWIGLDSNLWAKYGEEIDIEQMPGYHEGKEIENNYAPNPFLT